LMKKSLNELFCKTPKKEKLFSNGIIYSSVLPKWHLHPNSDHQASPQSSPIVQIKLLNDGGQSSQTPTSPTAPKGLADSLADALMSCVLLSSSLATHIATEALKPLSSTSVALFQKSPYKVLDGQSASSTNALSQAGDTLIESPTNQKRIWNLIGTSSDALSTKSDDNALNLFENFASKLSHSIMQSATRGLVFDSAVNGNNEGKTNESCDVNVHKDDLYESSSDKAVSDWDSDNLNNLCDMDEEGEIELELSIAAQQRLSSMVNDMTANVIRSAVNEAANDSQTIELSEREDAINLEDDISYEDDLTQETHFEENAAHLELDLSQVSLDDTHENNLDNELFGVLASDISVNIIQEVLEEFRLKTNMLAASSLADNVGGDAYSTLVEIDESDVGASDASSSVSSVDHTAELIQFVEVLTDQLIETGTAIASSALSGCSLQPVVTSIWCNDDNVIDVQMEGILQCLAASVVGCPAVVFHTMGDSRLEKV